MNSFTSIFLLALAGGTLLELWLLWRHARHVRAHRDQVPLAFAERFSLDEHHKAADYSLAKAGLGAFDVLLGAGLILVWTLGGALEALQTAWSGRLGSPLWEDLARLLSFMLVSSLLALPMGAWRTFVLERRFGFNRTTPGRFALDWLLEVVMTLVLGIPLGWAILSLMQGAGEFWWLGAWAVWMGFVLLLSWAFPVFIAPLFNKFTPLEDQVLRERVQRLLERCGFNSRGIFVMDGSRRSAHGNAYFTGLGRNKRIVFFDTLLGGLSIEEVEAVLAHELGHFRLHHVRKRLISTALLSLGGLALLGWLQQQPWFFSGLGLSQPSAAGALLLFLITVPVFGLFFQPLGSLIMRRHEYQADAYAVAHSGATALISALVKLYRDNASTLTPDPLYSAFHDSHPPAPLRIARITRLAEG